VLAGWSLGGLLSMHALFDRPEIFGGYLAISPSLWWDDRLLLTRAQALVEGEEARERDLVITIGTDEEGGLCYEAVQELARRWREAPPPGLAWELVEIPGEDHNHGPYKAYFDGVRALFADWFFPEAAFEQGLEALEEHYRGLSQRRGYPNPIPDHLYDALAMTYLSEGRGEDAIAVVERRCEDDPDSALMRYQLGEICRQAGRPERAREAYERALELEQHSSAPDSVFLRWLGGRLEDLESE
jgi:tetratricopeptide (TPR) repeat protein